MSVRRCGVRTGRGHRGRCRRGSVRRGWSRCRRGCRFGWRRLWSGTRTLHGAGSPGEGTAVRGHRDRGENVAEWFGGEHFALTLLLASTRGHPILGLSNRAGGSDSLRCKGDRPGAHLTARGTRRPRAGERSRRRRGGRVGGSGGGTRRGDGARTCRRVVIRQKLLVVADGNRPAGLNGGRGDRWITVAEHLTRGHFVDRLADATCGGDSHGYPSRRRETFRVPQGRSDDSNGLSSDDEISSRAQQRPVGSLDASRHGHGEIVSPHRSTPIVNR